MEGSQASRSYDTTLDSFYFRPLFSGLVYGSGNPFSVLFATSCAVLQARLEVHLSIQSVILIYIFNVNLHLTLAAGTCTVDQYIYSRLSNISWLAREKNESIQDVCRYC